MRVTEEDLLEQAILERVAIQDYHPEWPNMFESEASRLFKLAAGRLNPIEHFGSTAVIGLSAKPIIDILAGVSSLAEADELLPLLCSSGYSTSTEFNATLKDSRWLMRQENGHRTHHLHLMVVGSENWQEKIRFRDILREDPLVRQSYIDLKRKLAAEFGANREAYTTAKSDFVRDALKVG